MQNGYLKWLALFALAAVLLPATGFAAEGGGQAGWGLLGDIGRWVNLSIIIGLLYYGLRKPLAAFFREKKGDIERDISEARQARQEAEDKLAEVEAKTRALDRELEQIRVRAAENAESERQRLIAEAEKDAGRIVAAAEREIDNLKRHARAELQDYAARLAVELAEKRIRESMTDADEERAMERFFAQMTTEHRERPS